MLITFLGAITSFFAATSGAFQNDLKRVIAYSTCSQLLRPVGLDSVRVYSTGVNTDVDVSVYSTGLSGVWLPNEAVMQVPVNSPKRGVACLLSLVRAFLAPDISVSESERVYEKRFSTQAGDSHSSPLLHQRELRQIVGARTTDLLKHRHSADLQMSLTNVRQRVTCPTGMSGSVAESILKGWTSSTYGSALVIKTLHAHFLSELHCFKTHRSRTEAVVRGQDNVRSKWLANPVFSRLTFQILVDTRGNATLVNFPEAKGLGPISEGCSLLPLNREQLNTYELTSRKRKLNSLNYILFYSFRRSHCTATIKGRSHEQGSQTKEGAKDRLNQTQLKWPSPEELRLVRERVFAEQVKLAEWAMENGAQSELVGKKQLILIRSLDFRIMAVDSTSISHGRNTPGIDGLIFDPQAKTNMVEALRDLSGYKCHPVRRVYIPKTTGTLRPLVIPTIWDICVQQLLKLILEPVIEPFSDLNSFAYRPHRSAHNAIGLLSYALDSRESLYSRPVFKADIKGFFDEPCWLMSNISLPDKLKPLLKTILESGSLYFDKFEPTSSGTPQGGVISPLLANFTLDGLESAIEESLNNITNYKTKKLTLRRMDGTKPLLNLAHPVVCRFADDVVIIGISKNLLEKHIKPTLVNFLNIRGLKLSTEKTSLATIKEKELNYLGYTFLYNENSQQLQNKSALMRSKERQEGLALVPNTEKEKTIRFKLRQEFHNNQNATAYELIAQINPIIKGWCNYFKLSHSYRSLSKLEQFLYVRCLKWATRKHPRWGKKKIAERYFIKRFKGRNWNFHGSSKTPSRYLEGRETKTIYLYRPTVCVKVIAAKQMHMPAKIRSIHAYSPNLTELIEFNTEKKIQTLSKYHSPSGVWKKNSTERLMSAMDSEGVLRSSTSLPFLASFSQRERERERGKGRTQYVGLPSPSWLPSLKERESAREGRGGLPGVLLSKRERAREEETPEYRRLLCRDTAHH